MAVRATVLMAWMQGWKTRGARNHIQVPGVEPTPFRWRAGHGDPVPSHSQVQHCIIHADRSQVSGEQGGLAGDENAKDTDSWGSGIPNCEERHCSRGPHSQALSPKR